MKQNPYPGGDFCDGIGSGTGSVTRTTGDGRGLSVRVTAGAAAGSGVICRGVGSGTVGILNGSPRSIRTSLLAGDEGFSTLMENVLVAVAADVWNVTIARPSVSVVTSA